MYADVADSTTRDYYGSVSLVDHEVGRLVATLDNRGLRERTLILFTSDNGPEGLGATRPRSTPTDRQGLCAG